MSNIFGSVNLGNNLMMYYGRGKMGIGKSKSQREVAFTVPAALQGTQPTPAEGQPAPVVQCTISTLAGSNGTIFAVYQIDLTIVNSRETEVAVAALNTITDAESDLDFYCNIVIIGTPIATCSLTELPE